jgi:hypothetical protein
MLLRCKSGINFAPLNKDGFANVPAQPSSDRLKGRTMIKTRAIRLGAVVFFSFSARGPGRRGDLEGEVRKILET